MQAQNPELQMRQELINSLTHGFGILFGIVCIPILVTQAVKSGNPAGTVGTAIYGFSFLMVFTFSTLYHGFQHQRSRQTLSAYRVGHF